VDEPVEMMRQNSTELGLTEVANDGGKEGEVKAGLEKAGNGRNVQKQAASSPGSKIEAILIVGEYVTNPSPIAFSLPFDRRDD
jgi:hypothetical protein